VREPLTLPAVGLRPSALLCFAPAIDLCVCVNAIDIVQDAPGLYPQMAWRQWSSPPWAMVADVANTRVSIENMNA